MKNINPRLYEEGLKIIKNDKSLQRLFAIETAGILIITVLIILIVCFAPRTYAENYNYVQMRTAAFLNGCTKEYCGEPDGQFPIYLSAGHRWVDVLENVDIDVSYMHRSNLDIGWPRKGETGKTEYNRDGFTVGVTYKFNRN